jgi:8-hydroxy-5-deazaflavin:NADPH oxidoreductase
MKIGVLGTGQVGSTIAGKLKALGHDVMMGSRAPDGEKARRLAAQTGIPVVGQADAAAHGDWVVTALPGEHVLETLAGCAIGGKIMVDISNYDAAVDRPIAEPLGEAIQRAHPDVRVVKALNSVSAHLMVDPQSLGADHDVFIAGNDAAAKDEVAALLRSFGWTSVIDLGDLGAVRAMEQLIPLWMRLEATLGGANFNLAVVRGPQTKG